ncbi:MAG: PP2C family protein-serine/threonine phosphatase [bacterium]
MTYQIKRLFVLAGCVCFIAAAFSYVNAMCDCFGLCPKKNKIHPPNPPFISVSCSQDFSCKKNSVSFGLWSTTPKESFKSIFFNKEIFFVLADGHGKDSRKKNKIATRVCRKIIDYAYKLVDVVDEIDVKLFNQVFARIDIELIQDCSGASGSTASFVWVAGKKVYVATVGDSRVLWCDKSGSFNTSVDHNLKTNRQEQQRIEEAGYIGSVKDRKLLGLDVTRSMGDGDKKGYKVLTQNEYGKAVYSDYFMSQAFGGFLAGEYFLNYKRFGLSALPDCYSVSRDELSFIVIASRELWKSMSSDDVATFVQKKICTLQQKDGFCRSTCAEEIARDLAFNVPNVAFWGHDLSVVVILF